LLSDPLTNGNAHNACMGLYGRDGSFRAAEYAFRDKPIEPIVRDVPAFSVLLGPLSQLRRLQQRLPAPYRDRDLVEAHLASDSKYYLKHNNA
jgi:hypothetical protein